MRAVADTLEETVEPFFDKPDWEYAPKFFSSLPALKQEHRPTAFGGLEIFGTFVVFIGSCFAKKIFDEIYDRILKRPVAAQLDSIFSKLSVPDGKLIEYRDVVYFEDIDLIVVIRALVEKNNTKEAHEALLQGHRVAHAFVERNGKRAAIHCHTISNSQVEIEPFLFDSIEQIKQHDKATHKITRRY